VLVQPITPTDVQRWEEFTGRKAQRITEAEKN
jgi:hypothetical protein